MDLTYSCSFDLSHSGATRAAIMALEAVAKAQPDAIGEEECEARHNTHYFAPGVYGRMMQIPAGMCVVGKIHKHAHLNIITRGRIKVVTEFGEDVYVGPRTWVSEPGTKRAVVAIEDTEWVTIHHNPDDLTDVRELEKEIIAPTFEALDVFLLEQGEKP